MTSKQTYIALLRGINVGGHHKVPMVDLRQEMQNMGFKNVKTLLNSGNVIFKGDSGFEEILEKSIADHLVKIFGFSIPVMVGKDEDVRTLIEIDPFKDVEITPNTRLYVSFLRKLPETKLQLPWTSEDGFFKIIAIHKKVVCSVLDISIPTPEGMETLEQKFGKDITTRNWKTLKKIAEKLE